MSMTLHRAYVALGSNLGDRTANLQCGFEGLASIAGGALISRSSVIETNPVGPIHQGPYLNAAVGLETTLEPRGLLEGLLAIEAKAGRDRSREARWGPRTLDLDLLLYGDLIVAEEGLTVPHPRMHERAFVLGPLKEIAPDLIHPVVRMTIREMFDSVEKRTRE